MPAIHSFLVSRRDFSNWIKDRIVKCRFVENQDFTRFHKKVEANNATMIQYALNMDIAKVIAMVEGNHKEKITRHM